MSIHFLWTLKAKSRWRKRIKESGAEELLKETIEAGLRLKAIKKSQLKRVNVDTTVQEKFIRYPTDARLYDRARSRLVDMAKERNIKLRQTYSRVSKKMLSCPPEGQDTPRR